MRGRVLTVRELQVLAAAADDLSINETAARLDLSPQTIRTYRRRVLRKTGCRTMTGAVAAVFRAWLTLDPLDPAGGNFTIPRYHEPGIGRPTLARPHTVELHDVAGGV